MARPMMAYKPETVRLVLGWKHPQKLMEIFYIWIVAEAAKALVAVECC